ncbi:uncharacterized protein F4807DRAFT_471047 [Annulohypoxylon truncatum]|uniref:uncharacterized protein n=1 Tax=Annulohypoxylon truncatum TaxID=327061 RepID=UPI0020087998|nr:uncharacterized protein F4807DRAFT_471047 [Annulohypoxylon truncatum]KAI1205532.1 hypothetical protein F4807DRAFT_471047 [Annulohypoxylon truncatum]
MRCRVPVLQAEGQRLAERQHGPVARHVDLDTRGRRSQRTRTGSPPCSSSWALGTPDWDMPRRRAPPARAHLDPCDNRVLNSRGGDDDIQNTTVLTLREVLNAVTTVIGIGASFAGLGEGMACNQHADLGAVLSKVVIESMKSFTSANNQLMSGSTYDKMGDIKSYLQGKAFVAFGGVDKNGVVDVTNAVLLGNAVNVAVAAAEDLHPGRQQLRGRRAGHRDMGPTRDYRICRDGKGVVLVLLARGQRRLLVEQVMGYAYDANKAGERVHEALQGGWRNPSSQSPS